MKFLKQPIPSKSSINTNLTLKIRWMIGLYARLFKDNLIGKENECNIKRYGVQFNG